VSNKIEQDFNFFSAKQHINGVMLQSSDATILSFASNKTHYVSHPGLAAVGSFYEKFNTTYP
jgi:hypothetical protein